LKTSISQNIFEFYNSIVFGQDNGILAKHKNWGNKKKPLNNKDDME
jgi:hypothetical protein